MSVTRLSPLVRVVLAPNPSPLTLDGTNTYIVGVATPLVIDPGPADDAHLLRVLEQSGVPSAILLTHTHPDHAEGADRFAQLSGCPVSSFTAGGIARIEDGRRIHAGDVTLTAVHTPGHASDHLSFFLEQERALFTGDHVLGRGTSVVAHPDGDMAAYLASLDRARALGATRLYPGHGPVIDDPDPVFAYYASHRLEREAEVLAAIDAGARAVPDMVARIYAAYPVEVHGAAALSVTAHLEKLRREGIVRRNGDGWVRTA